MKNQEVETAPQIDTTSRIQEIIADYRIACISREASLLGRKEVLSGKAKFGIFGDGKELAQLALAKQFKPGDYRSGYYRDQTIIFALNALSIQQYFAGIYAHADVAHEPASGGRQMGGHFATPFLDENGDWLNLTERYNITADISPTAGQMPRLLGLAQASKVYRNNPELHKGFEKFSIRGNEVAFGTIGDASTSEGHFWESINAAGVLQVPMVMSVWDDGYGISVPQKYQTTKESISEVLKGFQRTADKPGFEIFKVKGWDYAALQATYEEAVNLARTEHVPVLVHVVEITQPQGHSTSGSHERYKTPERMQFELDYDCVNKFKNWILDVKIDGKNIATLEELDAISKEAKKMVRAEQKAAWTNFRSPIDEDRDAGLSLIQALAPESAQESFVQKVADDLKATIEPGRKEILNAAKKALRITRGENGANRTALKHWVAEQKLINFERYSDNLYSEGPQSPMNVEENLPTYANDAELVDGRLILRENFDKIFTKYPEVLTFGEDTGKIGGVNQSMEGMQAKYGEVRVSDTGIREATILGQGIGMAFRGLRPIAEIQYLDYILYCLQGISDDLATVRYRTKGQQKAPLIIRTRGHRLEGVWHSGSPMAGIINLVRGVHVCVPRDMTTAAGFYNTLLKGDDPAIVIEPLNGYRTKERMPNNLGEYTLPLGVPEVVTEGTDITIVSYGSTCNLVIAAARELQTLGINAEVIDVRTLLPFDINHSIKESIAKTSRLMIVDEDVCGGASAYILDRILTDQKGYFHLDSEPVTMSAQDHRPAYGTDGDYFSKPSIDDIVETAYNLLREAKPSEFPEI